MMFKCIRVAGAAEVRFYLGIDVSMECKDAATLESSISGVATILALLTTLIPAYYVGYLFLFRRKEFTNTKYPEGVVTVENIAKEGEKLGERVSQLDSPAMLKSFGPCGATHTHTHTTHIYTQTHHTLLTETQAVVDRCPACIVNCLAPAPDPLFRTPSGECGIP